ncbi:MAG: hypothetical protein WCE54_16025 [Ignavibacteriaceae bacterium]
MFELNQKGHPAGKSPKILCTLQVYPKQMNYEHDETTNKWIAIKDVMIT